MQRRILVAMNDLNLYSDRPYRKSAKITGDVTANYHPHGTAAVYDTLVRMAQEFSLRYPLVDGQGNFGSVDGDAPAAERYTEARMSAVAGEMLADLDKETVDFGPNYDDSRRMPLVLPAVVPNLLVNGASGIAVGMATNIPPHNLTEIVRRDRGAARRSRACDIEELMRIVPGPDFPTGGIIYWAAPASATPTAPAAAASSCAPWPRSKPIRAPSARRIVVTEIPYQVNKATLIERIADLVKEGNLEGISRPARRVRPPRHAHRDRAQEGRQLARHPEQALRPHPDAEDVRRQHAGAGEQSAAHRERSLEMLDHYIAAPQGCRRAAHAVRPRQGREARPHPRGLPHRARPHRRAGAADPQRHRTRREASRSMQERFGLSEARRRRSSKCACSA